MTPDPLLHDLAHQAELVGLPVVAGQLQAELFLVHLTGGRDEVLQVCLAREPKGKALTTGGGLLQLKHGLREPCSHLVRRSCKAAPEPLHHDGGSGHQPHSRCQAGQLAAAPLSGLQLLPVEPGSHPIKTEHRRHHRIAAHQPEHRRTRVGRIEDASLQRAQPKACHRWLRRHRLVERFAVTATEAT